MLLGNFNSEMVNFHHKENIIWASSTLNILFLKTSKFPRKNNNMMKYLRINCLSKWNLHNYLINHSLTYVKITKVLLSISFA